MNVNHIIDTIVDNDDGMGKAAQVVAELIGLEYKTGDSCYVAADGDGEYEMAAYVRGTKALFFGYTDLTPAHLMANDDYTLLEMTSPEGLLEDIPESKATIVSAASYDALIAEFSRRLAQ